MQVSRVELGGLGQTLPIENGQAALSEVERSFGSQLHQRAINVDRGEPQGIAQLRLCEGQPTRVLSRQTHRAQLSNAAVKRCDGAD